MGKKLMEYKIISGNTVEIRRTYMTAKTQPKPRGMRIAGNSSVRKIKANEREQIKKLARVLNCNIEDGWMLVTLSYNNSTLPADYAALETNGQKFMRRLREAFKREYGHAPKCILVNANWSPERNAPARLHHHLLIEGCSVDLLRSLWTAGGAAYEDCDSRKDHTALAVYLMHNVQLSKEDRHKQIWHPSRGNLAKPIYTEPVEVEDAEDIEPVKGSVQTDFERVDDECGRAMSTYIRCTVEERPRIGGRQIIFSKSKKDIQEVRVR